MRVDQLQASFAAGTGSSMMAMIEELYPFCRSITGPGVRQTLDVLRREASVELHAVASGTEVFDWKVPKEWTIRDAYVADERGERVIDFAASNLHVLNYSTPIREHMTFSELRPHLHSLEDRPDWIPYRTSYYNETWGFCLRHRDLEKLAASPEAMYEVVIDARLEDGVLNYGELYLPGESEDEILLTTHICHPSMCNDNLSGIALLTTLAKLLTKAPHRYSYRLLFIPGTIGSIAWLALNEARLERVRHGLVLAGVGDSGPITYKRSRRGDADIDRAVAMILRETGAEHRLVDFSPYGYDERQFCSPAFNLPVGRFSRSEYAQYPEYHTSADNLDFVSAVALEDSLKHLLSALAVLEANLSFQNLNPRCEPQLGKRGLYDDTAGRPDAAEVRMALLWVLNLSDGEHSLLDIAERSELPFASVVAASEALRRADLLELVSG